MNYKNKTILIILILCVLFIFVFVISLMTDDAKEEEPYRENSVGDVITDVTEVETQDLTATQSSEVTDTKNEESKSDNLLSKNQKSYNKIYTSTMEIDSFGETTIYVGTIDGIYGLVVEILDSDNNQIYYTQEEHRYIGDCIVGIVDVYVGDLNKDSLEDITIIYSSYLGRGYLGGLEFNRSYVLLQMEDTFVFDQEQHDLGNELRVDTMYENVVFYYGENTWDDDTYVLDEVQYESDNEHAEITYRYPIIESKNEALEIHTNNLIESHVNSILYDFNELEEYFTLDNSYDVTRSDRFLSVVFEIYWNVTGTLHPNIQINTMNVDLKKGTSIRLFEETLVSESEIIDFLSYCKGISYAG